MPTLTEALAVRVPCEGVDRNFVLMATATCILVQHGPLPNCLACIPVRQSLARHRRGRADVPTTVATASRVASVTCGPGVSQL